MGRMDDGCYPLDSDRHSHWKGTLLHVHKESEKKITKNRIDEQNESWNSKIELQCVIPYTQDQSNKV